MFEIVSRTPSPPLKSLCLLLVLGSPVQTGLGGSHFTTSLPGSGKSGPGVFFVSLREGGGSRPLTPHSQQRGQKGAESRFLGQGGPQWPL